MNLCVFAASSSVLIPLHVEAAEQLGRGMAAAGHALVFGGGHIGLMGVLARAVHQQGGRVIGVIPEKLRDLELAYEQADELIITQTMRDRKRIMEEKADAFVALPGGFGTLEEVMEILVLKQLGYHLKPLVFLNSGGIYDRLFQFFDGLIEHQLVRPNQRQLYAIANTADEVLTLLEATMRVHTRIPG